jgi:hypothetical protein
MVSIVEAHRRIVRAEALPHGRHVNEIRRSESRPTKPRVGVAFSSGGLRLPQVPKLKLAGIPTSPMRKRGVRPRACPRRWWTASFPRRRTSFFGQLLDLRVAPATISPYRFSPTPRSSLCVTFPELSFSCSPLLP